MPNCHNPVGVDTDFGLFTQGSSCLATLGWMPLPRWGNSRTPQEETALEREIAANDAQIERLVHELYSR